MNRASLAALAAFMAGTPSACAGKPGPTAMPSPEPEPRWEDVLPAAPELVFMLRPRALRGDAVYGALLERTLDLARERSRVVAATRVLDAMSDAEEVVVSMRTGGPEGPGEIVIVVQGVRADLDPMRLVDPEGRALWAPGPSGRVRELRRVYDPNIDDAADGAREASASSETGEASLFELPGRTWLVATGQARVRARDAFARPRMHASIRFDPDALASIRIAGPPLVAHVRALQGTGGLAAVGRTLRALTLVLPSEGGRNAPAPRPSHERRIQATFSYDEPEAAEIAEATLSHVVDAVAHMPNLSSRQIKASSDHADEQASGATAGLEWFARASVRRGRADEGAADQLGHPAKRVVLTAVLPRALVDDLLRIGSPAAVARTQNSPALVLPAGLPPVP